MHRLTWFITTIGVFSNWPSIYRRQFFNAHSDAHWSLRLRGGPTIEVAEKNTELPVVVEVWKERVYGDISFLGDVKKPVVIDIGGNVGSFSLLALHEFPSCRVVAFEPEPTNFALLKKNFEHNGYGSRATAVQSAVAGAVGSVTLYLTGKNTGTNSLYTKTDAPLTVACTTLAGILADYSIDRVDLLKIDCEGAEYDILLNSSRETMQKIGRIVLEWHDIAGHSREELRTFFKDNNFSVVESDEHRLIWATRGA